MANRWTKEQKQAIDARGSDLLIAAAAGSGKTAVLVERIITKLLREGQEIDRLLVVTFTNAAASEMRQRIGVAIAKQLEETPEDIHLQNQMAFLPRADIKTIHAFCLQVIREYYHLLELDPKVRTADPAEIKLLQKEVLEELFETLYAAEDSQWFFDLLETFSSSTKDTPLQDLVLQLYTFAEGSPNPKRQLEQLAESLFLAEGETVDACGWFLLIRQSVETALDYARYQLKKAWQMADEGEFGGYHKLLTNEVAMVENFAAALQKKYADWRLAYLAIDFARLPAYRGEEKETAERIKALRNEAKDTIKKLQETIFAYSPEMQADLVRRMYPVAQGLARLTKLFLDAFAAAKREKNMIDFHDYEHFALEILVNEDGTPTEAAAELRQRYDEIMIDEYQDSNLVQETILAAVSGESIGENNRFMVGDVKQSIYRFRLADPTIFLDKYKRFASAETAEEGKERKILLSQNFRSRKEILDAANFVFANILSTEMGEMEYGEDEMLHFGAAYYPERTDCDTEFHLIAAHQRSEEETRPVKKLLAEARFTARRIRQLLDEGYPVTGEEGTLRPCRPEDIVILMRSPGSRSAVFAQALAEEDVPCSFEDSGDYFQSMEISVTVSLLEIIDNPRQDVPLISVLRSPIFGFTPDRLAEIRSCDREGDFYDALRADTGVDSQNFLQVLTQLRETAMDISVCQLLWHIYDRLALPGIFGAMEGGALRQENLMALSRYAEHFEANDYRGLFAFITQLRRLLDAGNAPAVKTTGGSGGVQMMSIHKSKGLEFPIVFLCDLDHSFSNQDFDTPVLVHPTLGLGPHCIDLKRKIRYPTMARLALEETLRRENLAEEQRVLYVAMTRPKEKLILVASMYHTEKRLQKLTAYAACPALPEAVAEGRCFGDWILLPLLCRPEAAPLRERAGVEVESLYTGDTSPWQVFIHDANDYGEAPKKEILQAENASGHTEFDPAVLNYRYPYQRETQLPAKLTATQLKGRALDEEIAEDALHTPYIRPLTQPKFRQQDRGLTPAERGTATHLVLQYLDLRNPNVPEQVAALRLRAKLTPEQAAAVDIRALERFLSSPLAEEMRRVAAMEREYRFTVLMDARDYDGMSVGGDEILLQGVVDCWFETPDGLTVVDFKTDRVFTEEELTERAELYRGQLSAYTLALERVLERPVTRRVLYFLSVGRAVEVS